MAEDRDALLRHYRQMREELLAAIQGLSDELLTDPSLDGWSVKDHLAHVALWDEIRASEVARISAGHASAWRMDGQQDGPRALSSLPATRALSCRITQAPSCRFSSTVSWGKMLAPCGT